MNSSRCSNLLTLILVLLLTVGAAGAVTISQADVPSDAEVGTDPTATFVLNELYQDPATEQWTLRGQTELTNVTWTVQVIDQAGSQVTKPTYTGQTFEHSVDIGSGAAEIRISVTGTVPAIGNYTYSPAESFLLAEFSQAQPGGTSEPIQSYETHHYTSDSREARQAIQAAQAAIEAAGGQQQAERTLDSAIDAYESENFDLAIELSDQAEETAKKAAANRDRNRLILLAVGALILIGLVIGGVAFWRRNRTQSRL